MWSAIKVNLFLIGIILLLFGISMVILSMSIFIHTRKLLKTYDVKGKAKIKKFTKHIGHDALMPIYVMIYDDMEYELRSNMGAIEQEYNVGDEVEVWFKSENPFKFISEVEMNMWNRLNMTFKTLGLYAILPAGLMILISIILGIFIR